MNRANRGRVLLSVFETWSYVLGLRRLLSQFLDASADIDAQMQEREQGTMSVEIVLCGLCYTEKNWDFGRTHLLHMFSTVIQSVSRCLG